MRNPGRAGERAPHGADGPAGAYSGPSTPRGWAGALPLTRTAVRVCADRPYGRPWPTIYRRCLRGNCPDRTRHAPVSRLGRLLQRPGSRSGGCLGADGGDEGAGPVPADPQPGAEVVAGDGPAGCRAVLGVEFPGRGPAARPGAPAQPATGRRWPCGLRLLRLPGCGWRADGVDLAQHPRADLAPADQQRRADRVDQGGADTGGGRARRRCSGPGSAGRRTAACRCSLASWASV